MFDIVLTMHGLGNFSEELQNCLEIDLGRYKLKVLGVDRILSSKRAANRKKDKLVIPVLEDSLATNKIVSKLNAAKSISKRMRRNKAQMQNCPLEAMGFTLKFRNSLHNTSDLNPRRDLIGEPIRKTAAYSAYRLG